MIPNIKNAEKIYLKSNHSSVSLYLLRAPIDNRQLFASEGATLSGIN